MKTIELVKDRGAQYGHPKVDFSRTAALWTAYMGFPFTAKDVPMLMILLKCSREKHKHKQDNIDDIQGYALTRVLLEEEDAEKK